MGANPELLSALRKTEALIAVDGTYTRDAQTLNPVMAARYGGEHLVLMAQWGLTRHALNGVDGPDVTLDNLVVGIGYRGFKTDLGGLYRRGVAIRSELGIDVNGDGGSRVARELVVARPFDFLRFAPGQHFQTVVEARYELVGCHAPFVHMQAGVRARKDTHADTVGGVGSITVGAHTMPDWTVYGAYDLLVSRYPTPGPEYRILSRFRGGFEFPAPGVAWSRVSVVGSLEVGPPVGLGITGLMSFPFELAGAP
jgi:hypothetical protein